MLQRLGTGGIAFVLIAVGLAAQAEYQANTAAASLAFDGVQGTAQAASVSLRAQGDLAQLDFASVNVGAPYDVLISLRPLLPASQSGVVTATGQIVNVDLSDPALAFLSTGTPSTSFGLNFTPASFSFALTVPTSLTVQDYSAQMAILDPSNPDGLTLSQGTTLQARVDWGGHPYQTSNLPCPGYVTPVALGNDGVASLTLQAPFTFYGTVYTEVFVHSNGFVTFGAAGPLSAIPDATSFNAGVPMIAACATDFDPALGGTVTMGTIGPTFDVCFTGVPLANGTGANTLHVQVNPGGMFILYDAGMNVVSATVGFSAGGGLNPVVPLNWSWMGGPNGPLSFLQSGVPYSPVQVFDPTDPFDLAGNQMIWLFGAGGVPMTLP